MNSKIHNIVNNQMSYKNKMINTVIVKSNILMKNNNLNLNTIKLITSKYMKTEKKHLKNFNISRNKTIILTTTHINSLMIKVLRILKLFRSVVVVNIDHYLT